MTIAVRGTCQEACREGSSGVGSCLGTPQGSDTGSMEVIIATTTKATAAEANTVIMSRAAAAEATTAIAAAIAALDSPPTVVPFSS